MKTLLINLISFYQQYISFDTGALSLLTPGGVCKYQPSCSEYTKQQIIEKGVSKGLSLGIRRLISCR